MPGTAGSFSEALGHSGLSAEIRSTVFHNKAQAEALLAQFRTVLARYVTGIREVEAVTQEAAELQDPALQKNVAAYMERINEMQYEATEVRAEVEQIVKTMEAEQLQLEAEATVFEGVASTIGITVAANGSTEENEEDSAGAAEVNKLTKELSGLATEVDKLMLGAVSAAHDVARVKGGVSAFSASRQLAAGLPSLLEIEESLNQVQHALAAAFARAQTQVSVVAARTRRSREDAALRESYMYTQAGLPDGPGTATDNEEEVLGQFGPRKATNQSPLRSGSSTTGKSAPGHSLSSSWPSASLLGDE
ncbi:hypothetical protein BESB_068110 [Besnoitia besnoiti]|uniref:Uncharacterized protein n=1 Tax=Besnoitia besnoiti TaxID=94643 RepID=A0A2A9M8H7_BESBE|nr:hypothetical protein BESB_068110 [Besnoitia besnoiti]PFH34778.1 hypothetical protein BESB_068110 [Besnoitia besnoiti]